jgi:hypothetical protein
MLLVRFFFCEGIVPQAITGNAFCFLITFSACELFPVFPCTVDHILKVISWALGEADLYNARLIIITCSKCWMIRCVGNALPEAYVKGVTGGLMFLACGAYVIRTLRGRQHG